jgi:uncharacterized protein (DUF305 family)
MKRFLAASAALVTLSLVLAGCGGEEDDLAAQISGTTSTAPPTAPAGHTAADVLFAKMMIPHHVQAVTMSETLLDTSGVDERVRKLAEDIRAEQQPEIDQMTTWLRDRGAQVSPTGSAVPMDEHAGHVSGMLTEKDLKALDDAKGAEAEQLFLEQMIRHHEGAIAMARSEVVGGTHPEMVALAKAVVADQQAEIATMKELLKK